MIRKGGHRPTRFSSTSWAVRRTRTAHDALMGRQRSLGSTNALAQDVVDNCLDALRRSNSRGEARARDWEFWRGCPAEITPLCRPITTCQREAKATPLAKRRLDVALDLVFPRQLIERRFVTSFPVTTFRHVKLLVLVISNAGTVLIAPTISFFIDASRFH